jgi:hypothetical protein
LQALFHNILFYCRLVIINCLYKGAGHVEINYLHLSAQAS